MVIRHAREFQADLGRVSFGPDGKLRRLDSGGSGTPGEAASAAIYTGRRKHVAMRRFRGSRRRGKSRLALVVLLMTPLLITAVGAVWTLMPAAPKAQTGSAGGQSEVTNTGTRNHVVASRSVGTSCTFLADFGGVAIPIVDEGGSETVGSHLTSEPQKEKWAPACAETH